MKYDEDRFDLLFDRSVLVNYFDTTFVILRLVIVTAFHL